MSRIQIQTKEKRFPVAPDLYGLFFEDISRAGDGGLYPEMLRNRSFEDSLFPEGCITKDGGKTFVSPTGWIDEFNGGEGMNDWLKKHPMPPTPIPAWYSENAEITLNGEDTLNKNRRVSLQTSFHPGGVIRNVGFCGVPQEKGKRYHLYAFIKADRPVTLEVSIAEGGNISACGEIEVGPGDYTRHDLEFTASMTTGNAELRIMCGEEAVVTFGFISLMPCNTFMGHGLRVDLVEKLRDIHPSFLRFPGGCIVEGFTKQTAMYFKNTVGPVWERPSHWLLWHYRTTNGLGFHEFLQLCEDLGISPLYVCNCGMSCQGRQPYYFTEEETKEMLEDTLAALEYARGPVSSKWGALRAKMGHAEPFPLRYLEIGNENSGPEYERRYKLVRKAVLERYPDLTIIANDRGRGELLEADVVDDHYYNMPEFFAENVGIYDSYDRTKPNVFVGEFAVNQTYEGQLRAAISEAMFMVGLERNQDAVKLASYAPLFENVNFYSWYPNLIIFDNRRSYAIPTYYAWRLFGGNRGDYVVRSEEKTGKIYRDFHGLPMVCGDFGMRFRNAVYNGKSVAPTRELLGKTVPEGDEYVLAEDPESEFVKNPPPFHVPGFAALGEDIESREGVFEAEVFAEEGKEIGVGVLCAPKPLSFYDRMNPNPHGEWMLTNLEPLRFVIRDGKAQIVRGTIMPKPVSEQKSVELAADRFHKLRCEVAEGFLRCYVNGKFVVSTELPHYPTMASVTTVTDREIIIKAVNFADTADEIAISLDCEVESDYTLSILSGAADAENSLENPDNVHDEVVSRSGAAKEFRYTAPPLSASVLRLRKK
jgi:alpha-N-arabinofuranosidase